MKTSKPANQALQTASIALVVFEKERGFISEMVGRPIDDYVEVFRLAHADTHFWTMNDVLKESSLEHICM